MMRQFGIRCCNLLAWLAILTALPGIWVAGFLRGVGIALHPEPEAGRWSGRAVLTDVDTATILGTHESALRRGEARWQ